MIDLQTLIDAQAAPLLRTDLQGQGRRIEGKVRDVYDRGDTLLLVSTDRVSAFDRVLGAIPFRGQVLNQLSAWWFEQTADVVANHLLAVPDPNVTLARKAHALPVEVVVRGYITGVTDTSLWTLYAAGEPAPYGLTLPAGLCRNARLPQPVITPTTKAAPGEHDARLSEAEVVGQGHVSAARWAEVREVALRLFARGSERAAAAGLVLVDTKYEFGVIDGQLTLIDEVHTPDSSRYWTADSHARSLRGEGEPEGYSKEFLREWLRDQGFKGEGAVPVMPPALLAQAAQRYIGVYEHLTGRPFDPARQPAGRRIADTLAKVADGLSDGLSEPSPTPDRSSHA